MPILVLILDAIHLKLPFFGYSEVHLVLPVLEIAEHVVGVHFQESSFYLGVQDDPVDVGLFPPEQEVREKPLTEHVSSDVSSPKLRFCEDGSVFVHVPRGCAFNSWIHVLFNGSIHGIVFSRFRFISQGIVAVL